MIQSDDREPYPAFYSVTSLCFYQLWIISEPMIFPFRSFSLHEIIFLRVSIWLAVYFV